MSLMTALQDVLSLVNVPIEVVGNTAVVPTGFGFVVLEEIDERYLDARINVGTETYCMEILLQDVVSWIYIWTGRA